MKRLFLLVFSLFISTCFGEIHRVDVESTDNTPEELYIKHVQRALKAGGRKQRLTMLSHARLDNIQYCLKEILANDIPGDCIETGVFCGGATIFMRAILEAYQDRDRRVWVADSFQGFPKPNLEKYPADGEFGKKLKGQGIPLQRVMNNFARFGLLDNRVVFLKGFFSETLPTAPIEQISLLRLDGDMYESTWDALNALYHKVSPGGFIIIDEYGAYKACKKAVHDFRETYQIHEPMQRIDWTGVFWKKTS